MSSRIDENGFDHWTRIAKEGASLLTGKESDESSLATHATNFWISPRNTHVTVPAHEYVYMANSYLFYCIVSDN
jgi:hypothetical protein